MALGITPGAIFIAMTVFSLKMTGIYRQILLNFIVMSQTRISDTSSMLGVFDDTVCHWIEFSTSAPDNGPQTVRSESLALHMSATGVVKSTNVVIELERVL